MVIGVQTWVRGVTQYLELNLRSPSDAMGNDGDIDTVDTAGSDDGHSDIDDVPDIAPSEKAKLDEVKPVVPLGDKLRAFFSGRMYKHMSAIFGTMVCFFLVGMRVETLLHATGAIGDPGNTCTFTQGNSKLCSVCALRFSC